MIRHNSKNDSTFFLPGFSGRWSFLAFFFLAVYLRTGFAAVAVDLVMFVVSGFVFVGVRRLQREHFTLAVVVSCGMLLLMAVIATLAVPMLYVANILAPLMVAILGANYIRGHWLRLILAGCWCSMLIVLVLGTYVPTTIDVSPQLHVAIIISGFIVMSSLTLLLLGQFAQRQNEMVFYLRNANDSLQDAQANLETQVAERTRDLQAALCAVQEQTKVQATLLEEVGQQREVIRDLAVPVIPINRTTLVMPLIGEFDADRLIAAQEQALHAIERQHVRTLILDITGVPFIDTNIANGILMIVRATKLLGAETILVGIRPEVAQTLISLDIYLPGLRTFSELQAVFTV